MVQSSLLAPGSPSETAAEITRESLGAHILAEIARCNGPQLPHYSTEQILTGFWERFGPHYGMAICRQAFEISNGIWMGAPVTIERFQAHHDSFFARPLLVLAGRE